MPYDRLGPDSPVLHQEIDSGRRTHWYGLRRFQGQPAETQVPNLQSVTPFWTLPVNPDALGCFDPRAVSPDRGTRSLQHRHLRLQALRGPPRQKAFAGGKLDERYIGEQPE
jgi:hypothetical protein